MMDGLISLLTAEPYLGSELAGFAMLLPLFWLAGSERGRMLLAAGVMLPVLPVALMLDAGYWTPRRLGGLPIGIEDLLYMVQLGASAWFFATRVRSYRPGPGATAGGRRLGLLTLAALCAWVAVSLLALGWTDGLIVTALAIGVGLLARRPAQWPAALAGGIGTASWFGVQLHLWFLIWPELPGWWVPGVWSSLPLLGLPVGELVYAGLIGAVHPLALAAVLGGTLTDPRELPE